MELIRRTILVSALLASVANANTPWRKTEVIEDRGGIAITEYVDIEREERSSTKPDVERGWWAAKEGLFAAELFPVATPNMSVGRISDAEAQGIHTELLQFPFFVVGYDPVSIEWLKDNAENLAKNGAMGLVVNVATPDELRELYEASGNQLILNPASGETLPGALGLTHYPAYMHPRSGLLR